MLAKPKILHRLANSAFRPSYTKLLHDLSSPQIGIKAIIHKYLSLPSNMLLASFWKLREPLPRTEAGQLLIETYIGVELR